MTSDPQKPSTPAPPLAARLMKGTLWMFAMRWAIRLMGIVSVVVLARLLDKADFGLVAMAMAVIALPSVLMDFGLAGAIIREKNPTPGLYNTAWTIKLIKLTIVAIIVYLAGPFAADFYGDPRIGEIMPYLALMVFINGLESMWVVAYRKDMRFHADFLYNASCKLLSVIVTIGLAFYLRSYWALVYGQVFSSIIQVVISIAATRKLPHFTLSHWRQMWFFARWTLVRGLAFYVINHGDRVMLGRFASADMVGAYSIAREIASMPISEISSPANRALGPGFSAIQDQHDRLAQAIIKSIGAIATITFPIGLGFAAVATEAIPVMLGDGWQESVPLLQILSVSAVMATLTGVCNNTLAVIGYIRDSAITAWIRAIVLIAAGIPGAIHYGAEGVAAAFLLSGLFSLANTFHRISVRIAAVKVRAFLKALARPAASAAIMLVPVLWLGTLGITSPALLLAAKIATGGAVYTLALYLMWLAVGRPDGLERVVMNKVTAHFRRN